MTGDLAKGKTLFSKHCAGCHGFYGASSMERLPAEAAIREQTAQFKKLAIKKNH